MIDIYYLDDEPALCSIFEHSFASDEINIKTFTNAAEAIAACEASPPKAIFIDMRLEDTTGNQVAEKISDSVLKYLVTGDLVNTSDYPFEDVLFKPFDMHMIDSLLTDLANK